MVRCSDEEPCPPAYGGPARRLVAGERASSTSPSGSRPSFTSDQVEAFGDSLVTVVLDHPAYQHEAVLSGENKAELLADLKG